MRKLLIVLLVLFVSAVALAYSFWHHAEHYLLAHLPRTVEPYGISLSATRLSVRPQVIRLDQVMLHPPLLPGGVFIDEIELYPRWESLLSRFEVNANLYAKLLQGALEGEVKAPLNDPARIFLRLSGRDISVGSLPIAESLGFTHGSLSIRSLLFAGGPAPRVDTDLSISELGSSRGVALGWIFPPTSPLRTLGTIPAFKGFSATVTGSLVNDRVDFRHLLLDGPLGKAELRGTLALRGRSDLSGEVIPTDSGKVALAAIAPEHGELLATAKNRFAVAIRGTLAQPSVYLSTPEEVH